MQTLIKYFFNVDPAPWTHGGSMRLDWLNLPQHGYALAVIVAALLAAAGILYLYKREGKTLSLPVRTTLASLRFLALLGVLAMLLEPAIVFVKREMMPSRLLVLMDTSESMDLQDAYADAGQGGRIAAALQLKSLEDLRDQKRLALAARALDHNLARKLDANGDRAVTRTDFTGQLLESNKSATDPSTIPGSQPAVDRSTTGIGTAITQALAAYRGQPLAGILLISDRQCHTGAPLHKR